LIIFDQKLGMKLKKTLGKAGKRAIARKADGLSKGKPSRKRARMKKK